MYKSYPTWITAFHGCDQRTFEKVLYHHDCLEASENSYDWLGHGIYFWENNPLRAYDFAIEQLKRGKIEKPAVIGAMIDLGSCLDLTDMASIKLVREVYPLFVQRCKRTSTEIPQNSGKTSDRVYRNLDCAVLEFLHFVYSKSSADQRFLFTKNGYSK